jgi:glycosyltransferase involved in cell wall biosynthesis
LVGGAGAASSTLNLDLMRCPTLNNLPQPPPGKTGWPWTEESPQLPDRMPDGSPWPRISIVTPSYNQGQFIEETIRSVLLQGYPDLEYIVMDGGSTDDSIEIINNYQSWISHWTSEKDEGQADAINKGLRTSNGEIVAWLNSDDVYERHALQFVTEALVSTKKCWICGACRYFKNVAEGKVYYPVLPSQKSWLLRFLWSNSYSLPQPSIFWSKQASTAVGELNKRYHYSFDHEYWIRIRFAGFEPLLTNTVLSRFRLHDLSKTCAIGHQFEEEDLEIAIDLARRMKLFERLIIVARTKKFRGERQIWRQLPVNTKQSFSRLLSLLVAHPMLVFSRMFWGAIKREVVE